MLPEFFEFYNPTKVVYGVGIASDFQAELDELGVEKYFIVSDKVIRDQRVHELERHLALRIVHKESHGPKDLPKKPHCHDRPMPDRVRCSPPVSEPIYADHHPHSLPYHWMVQWLHPYQRKEVVR